MTSPWSVVVPEAAVNLLPNPSVELTWVGFLVSAGGTLARSAAQQRRGLYSLAWTPNANPNESVYSYPSGNTANGTTVTVALDFKGILGRTYSLFINNVAGTHTSPYTTFMATGAWQRVQNSFLSVATEQLKFHLTKVGDAGTDVLYVDGVQWEEKAYATTYFDGNSPGCSWNGVAHASTSARPATLRSGGRVVDFDTFHFRVVNDLGTGAPPVENRSVDYVQVPGGMHQSTKINSRLLTLVGPFEYATLADLLAYRKALYEAVRPDPMGQDQPVLLRYTGPNRTLEIPVYYDAGLEAGENFGEFCTLRFFAAQPNWREALDV